MDYLCIFKVDRKNSTMVLLLLFALSGLFISAFMNSSRFGAKPSGERLARIRKSPNYAKGEFQNLSPTANMREGATIFTVMYRFFFNRDTRNKPKSLLPSVKTDLKQLPMDKDVLVWFGHSSYFLQVSGKRFLVDPVFGGSASPIRATTRSFDGSDVYAPADMPELDYLLLSHDHWDHLDHDTIRQLLPKAGIVITALGTGAHLERWGYGTDRIIEKDWWQETELADDFTLIHTPARHFSGRGFRRNQALWTSFVLKTPTKNLYLGGDSGYDSHFKAIGEKFGPFDLAILECGQYNTDWPYIHMLPGQWVKAATDLKAKAAMPVHWGKFTLALHAWDEPVERFVPEMESAGIKPVTPMIGQVVDLDDFGPFRRWWLEVE